MPMGVSALKPQSPFWSGTWPGLSARRRTLLHMTYHHLKTTGSPLTFFVYAALAAGAILAALSMPAPAHAAGSYAWGDTLGWVNFSPTGAGITVTDDAVTGYAWSRDYGWIAFAPGQGGVTNTPEGVLGGHAWSDHLGWIPFTGVRISEDGRLTGIAGEAGSPAGRLSFDCSECRVTTAWRPTRTEAVGSYPASGGRADRGRMLPPLSRTFTATPSPVMALVNAAVTRPVAALIRSLESRITAIRGVPAVVFADETRAQEPFEPALPPGPHLTLAALAILLLITGASIIRAYGRPRARRLRPVASDTVTKRRGSA